MPLILPPAKAASLVITPTGEVAYQSDLGNEWTLADSTTIYTYSPSGYLLRRQSVLSASTGEVIVTVRVSPVTIPTPTDRPVHVRPTVTPPVDTGNQSNNLSVDVSNGTITTTQTVSTNRLFAVGGKWWS